MATQTTQPARITRAPNMTPIHIMGTRHAVAIARVSVVARAQRSVFLRERSFAKHHRQ
jgi:hypothetical protein